MKHHTSNAALIAFTARLLHVQVHVDGFQCRSSLATRRAGVNTKRKDRSVRATQSKEILSPRYFLEQSLETTESHHDNDHVDVDVDVLVYKVEDSASFSLLKPYLEFNELDLQQLFTADKLKFKSKSSSSTGSSPQLFDEFREMETEMEIQIGRWNDNHDNDHNPSHQSPFYFAAHKEPSHRDLHLHLPPWLLLLDASSAPSKLRSLRSDLVPHLSSKQISSVLQAIRHAAKDDPRKMAGAADFCSLLVKSVEMSDVEALVASAFHYCSCVDVRERPPNTRDAADSRDVQYLCALAGSGIEQYSPRVIQIALDAARLKSVEMLAQSCLNKRSLGDASNLRSMLLSVNEEGDWRALAVRSAACLYRLEGLRRWRDWNEGDTCGHQARSRTRDESRAGHEALHVYAPLAARLGMFRLKTELEDAAFRTMYPRSHSKISALCDTAGVAEGMKSVLSDISNQMKRLVQEDLYFMEHIKNVSITARLKEPYSIWRKMVKMSKRGDKNLGDISILDIPDAIALRVVFSARKLTPDESDVTTQRRERALCYYILDLCTQTWPETSSSRFKDYVAHPKENGYRSLHYSSCKRWRGSEWPFEVQIRSTDMHRVAEYGVAAHWSYKRRGIDDCPVSSSFLCGNSRMVDERSESYLRSVSSRESPRSYIAQDVESEQPSVYIDDEIRRGRKREREERLAPYLEALSGAQTDMTRENVYVFVSLQQTGKTMNSPSNAAAQGTVLSLPRGSRVLDAIRATEKWSSYHSGRRGGDGPVVLRNGRRTAAQTERLDNGDVISILSGEVQNMVLVR